MDQALQDIRRQVTEIKVEWGRAVDPQAVADALKKDPGIKAVYVQASETSTGVAHDVKALAEIVKPYGETILVVDAITALGVFDIKTDEWGIDVVITGSQKALMLPPGLAFVSVSDKAWQLAEKAKNTAFYFNFKKEHENQQKNQTAYTPAVSLIVGLQEVLKMMKAEGLEGVFARQASWRRPCVKGCRARGSRCFPRSRPAMLSPPCRRRKAWMGRPSTKTSCPVRHDGGRRTRPFEGEDFPAVPHGLWIASISSWPWQPLKWCSKGWGIL